MGARANFLPWRTLGERLALSCWCLKHHRFRLLQSRVLRVFEGQTHNSVIPYFFTGLNEVYR